MADQIVKEVVDTIDIDTTVHESPKSERPTTFVDGFESLYDMVGIYENIDKTAEVKEKLSYIWQWAKSTASGIETPMNVIMNVRSKIGSANVDQKSYNRLYNYVKLLKINQDTANRVREMEQNGRII